MGFSFWFAEGKKGSGNQPRRNGKQGRYKTPPCSNRKKIELILISRLTALLEKYKDDTKVTDQILGEFNLYRVNITIARDFQDKSAEKTLTNNFLKFLSQF